MRLIKKILRIIAIILPCFCCLVLSHDSFATSYSVNSFYAHGAYYYDSLMFTRPSISVTSSLMANSDFSPVHDAYLTFSRNNQVSGGRCIDPVYHQGVSKSGNDVDFGGYFYMPNSILGFPNDNLDASCNQFGEEYGDGQPGSSFSGANINIQSFKSFNVYYLTMPFTGIRSRDGITYSGRLSLNSFLNLYYGSAQDSSDIDGDNSNDRTWTAHATDVTAFSFPLNFNSDEVITSAVITGSVTFSPSDSQKSDYGSVGYLTQNFLDYGHIAIESRYHYWRDSQVATSVTDLSQCSYSVSNNLLTLTYVCPVTLSHADMLGGSLGFSLRFYSDGSGSPLFQSDDLIFNNIDVITNGEESDVIHNASRDEFGAYPKVSPGNPDIEDAYGNWTDSFLNAIHFSLENPFSVFFNMFLAPDECANIPTLSRFLNLSNQRICRFYPDWIYPITTPVFSIITAVIIFGALIRWLSHDSFTYYRGLE